MRRSLSTQLGQSAGSDQHVGVRSTLLTALDVYQERRPGPKAGSRPDHTARSEASAGGPDRRGGRNPHAGFTVSEKRLVTYVDGSAVHVGANLRRDRFIREQLRNGTPGWRVVELMAKNLGEGAALARKLLGDAANVSLS